MYIGKEYISRIGNILQVILQVERNLEIVLPIFTLVAVFRQNRVTEEYFQTCEIAPNSLEYDYVRGNEEKVFCKTGLLFVFLMKIRPRNNKTHHFGLSRAGGHFY